MPKKKDYKPRKVAEDLANALFLGNSSRTTRSRAELMSWALSSYGGKRDLWNALGYILDPTFETYNTLYQRGDIATTIVNASPDECWRLKPSVEEVNKTSLEESEFEKRWKALAEEHKFFHYLHRADRISGIGQFGVIWLGFDDGDPEKPLSSGRSNIIFMRPLAEDCVEIASSDTDTASPRYGLPEMYRLTVSDPSSKTTSREKALEVHHSRILHIAEDCINNDVFGTPRLKNVQNRLQSLEMIGGGSAEMFWRGAFPGMIFNVHPDVQKDDTDLEEARQEISKFVHNLQRYLRVKGVDVQALPPTVSSPREHFDVQIALIAAARGIPQRILVGSERGELASTQDENAWTKQLEGRRVNHVEPFMLRPLIDILISVGSLPKPAGGYKIVWPDMREYSPKVRAETSELQASALHNYVRSADAQIVMPPEVFLRRIMNLDDNDIEAVRKILEDMRVSEDMETDRASDGDDDALREKSDEITEGGSDDGMSDGS